MASAERGPRYRPDKIQRSLTDCVVTFSRLLPVLPDPGIAKIEEAARFFSSPEGKDALRLDQNLHQVELPPVKLSDEATVVRYPGGRRGKPPFWIETSQGRRKVGKKLGERMTPVTYRGVEVVGWMENLGRLRQLVAAKMPELGITGSITSLPKGREKGEPKKLKKALQGAVAGLTVAGTLAGTASCVPLPQAAVVREIPQEEMQSGIQILEIRPIPVLRPTPDDLKFVSALPQGPERQAVISSQEEATPTTTATPTTAEIQQQEGRQAALIEFWNDRSSTFQEMPPEFAQVFPPEVTFRLGKGGPEITQKAVCGVELVSEIVDREWVTMAENFIFRYHPEIIARIDPALDLELKGRTGDLLNLVSRGEPDPLYFYDSDVYRDWLIYIYYNKKGSDSGFVRSAFAPSFARTYLTLAVHESEYVGNPAIQQTAQKMETSGAMAAINRMLRSNVNSTLFIGDIVPQLPETKEEILDSVIFAGIFGEGYKVLGGGMGYRFHPLLFGGYNRQDLPYDEIGRSFVNQFTHESIHSFWHFQRAHHLGEMANVRSPEGRFFHSLHSIPEDMAGRMTGLGGGGVDPRLVLIYGVLKEGGVEDPLAELLSSLASWSIQTSYDEVRGGHPTLEAVFGMDSWLQLPPEIKREIEIMYEEYKDEYVNSYTSYID